MKGVFAPGSLAGQGLSNLTVFGAGNTVGKVTGRVSYPRNSIWTFQSGLGWVAQIPGLAQVYFPNNIPEATKRRNSPPTWRVGADGIGEWIFRTGRINPPDTLPAFPDAKPAKRKTPVQGGGGLRKRWVDGKGKIYEWDYQHGTVEKYDKTGKKHLGEFDPDTGEQLKPPDKTRSADCLTQVPQKQT